MRKRTLHLRQSRRRKKSPISPGTVIASAGDPQRASSSPARPARQTASNDLSLSEAANPWNTSCTLAQFFSAFIRSSQRFTFGYPE